MTTNQTIDGVSRRMLTALLCHVSELENRALVDELRALLDAPAPRAEFKKIEMAHVMSALEDVRGKPVLTSNQCHDLARALNDRLLSALQLLAMPAEYLAAAQPKGEPVEYQSRTRPLWRAEDGERAWFPWEKCSAESFADYRKNPLIHDWQYEARALYAEQPAPFQSRVLPWLLECFGEAISSDQQERNHRFLEEALELVQACDCTATEAHQLVDHVYGRPIGEPSQEVGGVMVTLAALCLASGLDMHAAAETELARIWTKVDQIRSKQAAKPAMSPLPGAYPDREQPAPVAVASRDESIYWLKRIDGIGQARAELIYSMGFRRHTEVPQSR